MQYEHGALPLTLVDKDATARVDLRAMQEAARRSCSAADSGPHQARATRAANAIRARVFVAGAGPAVTLRARRISTTGIVLEVPGDVVLDVAEGKSAIVHLQVDGPAPRRLLAHVVHRRPAATGVPGGISLRWDVRDRCTRAEVSRVVTADPARPS